MMRHFRRLRVAVTALLTVLVGTVLAGSVLASTALASTASPNSHRGWVKYYIVKPPHDGLQEYLYEIAQHTLGSGKFAVQIFDLNKGRLEPGGERMRSASVIKPGWILLLPPNASGPGVHYGPLPAVTATPTPSATPSPTPTASPSVSASPPGQLTTAGQSSSRKLILQAAIAGALIMLLLTTGLFVFGRQRTPTAKPKPKPAPRRRKHRDGPAGRLTDKRRKVAWQDEPAELPAWPADDDSTGDGTEPVVPAWLGTAGPLDDPYEPAAPTAPTAGKTFVDWPRPTGPARAGSAQAGPAVADQANSDADDTSWPDFLSVADDDEPTIIAASAAVNRPEDPPIAREPGPTGPAGPPGPPHLTGPSDQDGEPDETVFSPAALRILGARPLRQRGEDDVPPQRHQVALGDDRIEVVLAEAPAASGASRARAGKTWLAAAPYLVWAPLPYDIPDDGLAFACIGAGDEGCLFIDLGAAPGAVAISGDPGAASRLAESVAHQLCLAASPGEATAVILVGGAIPEPHPAGASWVGTLRDLATADPDGPPDRTDIVFCELRSNEDAFVLARYVGSAPRRIIPVVLGRLPGAAWSFTAQPSPYADLTLPTLVSARPANRR